ncbi:electron transport complex protein RnfC [Hypnocyclicus thermotrophus]|uniref:Ion-translocating oxidoreductase complex subunit C n=1 Tax=Hypnocyclicus thermotrophus TaxID=1627895 RepID=A0AA46I5G9_9FUSO|nr:electron transport complex subunit RsxC [Hypnocyclicus thermotrophus]TDT69869.1 electron transport complex protein RnfC [Hypnocyclicus thermotrophus]
MKLFSFKGGIHPPENKDLTENLKIEDFKIPKEICIPLLQHIGVVLEPLVKVGDRVKKGQKIGDSSGFLSSPVHSSVSGVVKKIEVRPFPVSGRVNTVIIENDYEEEIFEYPKYKEYEKLTKDELLKIVREMGIVGQGGATFPTHIKLNPPKDKKIDVLLINGAECEPYLNADNRLMLEQTEKVVKGIDIFRHILGVQRVVIGIEENKEEAIHKMKEEASKYGMEIAVLKTKYPQGGEKQLIKAVLDREVPSGKLPSEVGVVVQNTATALSVYEAVIEGKPVIEKVLTVSGLGVKTPKNLRVRIGTQFKEILDYVEIDREKTEKLVMGGPMMGLAQHSEEVPVIKGTSGILALTKKEMNPYKSRACITCGKCVDACPMNLSPLMYAKLARFQEWKEMDKYDLLDCIECGSCSFVCPANRPLTEGIKIGKAKLRAMKR